MRESMTYVIERSVEPGNDQGGASDPPAEFSLGAARPERPRAALLAQTDRRLEP
jgi:hypothetical protein